MAEPISRRTALRAGAHTAWAVPAITLATAAPAHAALSGGSDLAIESGLVAYWIDASGVRADQLYASFALRNNGSTAATDIQMSLKIPGGLYAVAPNIIASPQNWIALTTTTGSLEDGWTINWFHPTPLDPGQLTGDEAPVFTIQYLDPLAESPYRRWQGDGYQVQIVVTSSNNAPVAATYDVTPAPPAVFVMQDYGGTYAGDTVTLHSTSYNQGRSSSGPTTVRYWYNPEPDGDPAWTNPPVSAYSDELGTGTVSGGGTSGNDPWYIAFDGPRTATRSSFPADATPEELATTTIAATIHIQLAAAPQSSRDFYMTVRAPDAQEPVPNSGLGWQSCIVGP